MLEPEPEVAICQPHWPSAVGNVAEASGRLLEQLDSELWDLEVVWLDSVSLTGSQ